MLSQIESTSASLSSTGKLRHRRVWLFILPWRAAIGNRRPLDSVRRQVHREPPGRCQVWRGSRRKCGQFESDCVTTAGVTAVTPSERWLTRDTPPPHTDSTARCRSTALVGLVPNGTAIGRSTRRGPVQGAPFLLFEPGVGFEPTTGHR
jgi:hypothetical protein